ncbi:MAG: gamma-glutamyl-gamma-aminobutyrate hydrolase family protein [Pirellulales bacterium]|nr:gamma-glutamyl-gamma-aminobutyrate hydrolase family protein [Pirellulales bacterium]
MRPVLVFRHTAEESLGVAELALRQAGLVYSYLDLSRESLRAFDPQQLAGLIVLGGAMNTDETEQHPFLLPEMDWIRAAVDHQVPVLGICLGAQLLARSLGARVDRNPVKEIGWYDLAPTAEAAGDPLFAHFAPRERVFQWHGDTFELPDGAVQLCRGESCVQQAFRYGETAYGVQFHAEVTHEIIEHWLSEPAGRQELAELDYIDPARIRAETPARLPAMHQLAEKLFGCFAALCAARVAG